MSPTHCTKSYRSMVVPVSCAVEGAYHETPRPVTPDVPYGSVVDRVIVGVNGGMGDPVVMRKGSDISETP